MEVDCEGCAGCCIDWRAIAPPGIDQDQERAGRYRPVDDTYNLVVLTRDDVREFIDAGLADALTPRLFHASSNTGRVTVDGVDLAAIDGRPVFYVGLRKPVKPVAPFGVDATWLPTCVFLDPSTLRCRIHGDDTYPRDCAEYPGHNIALEKTTECKRVEAAWGGTRLVDRSDPPTDSLLLGQHAVGQKLFVFPDVDALDGTVARACDGDLTRADRAAFVAAAATASPGTTAVNEERYDEFYETVLDTHSWAGDVIETWTDRPGDPGKSARESDDVERSLGVPSVESW